LNLQRLPEVSEKKLYTRVQLHKKNMQLPRGTFREIKKGELISSILDELKRNNFSGICSISSTPVSGTLVFKSGQCILAKIHHKSGDGALEELLKMSDHAVDAALSSLDEPQVQLALEFNKACRIIKGGKTPSATSHQSQKPTPAAHNEPAVKPHAPPHTPTATVRPNPFSHKPAPAASPAIRPSSSFTTPQEPAKKIIPPPQARAVVTHPTSSPEQPSQPKSPLPLSAEPKTPAETEDSAHASSSFEKDIETFDSLDLENVTDKIRNDCKTMIKQLQLEHLMER
jgi:hypothetical protein